MKQLFRVLIFLLLANPVSARNNNNDKYVLVIHGGAGSITPASVNEKDRRLYEQGLERALEAGQKILEAGGDAIDAVQAAINVLEDDSMFNAGKGSVYTEDGINEMDASIMNGSDLNCGAVAGVTTIKNPVNAARLVMDKSTHVLLARKGAEAFAAQQGVEIVDRDYFGTVKTRARYKNRKENRKKKSYLGQPGNIDDKYGTVGAVALDKHGNLAAGTSTGGMSGKKYGRIGDSPLIGAGTYADNNSCAVSCTGWGEYFIRLAMAKSICDRVELQGLSVQKASDLMLHEKLQGMGATGGVIVVDKDGNIAMTFNTQGMHRAWVTSSGEKAIKMFAD